MEPQTPPGRRVGPALTPNTPRYGPIDDTHFLDTRKKLFQEDQPDLMLTPRMTPRKRVYPPPKTPQRGSGRQGKRILLRNHLDKIDEGVYLSKPQPLASIEGHPHHDAPKEAGKGMWYVFRGKKVWRPFKAEEQSMEPTKLFDTTEYAFNSDSETDIEADSQH